MVVDASIVEQGFKTLLGLKWFYTCSLYEYVLLITEIKVGKVMIHNKHLDAESRDLVFCFTLLSRNLCVSSVNCWKTRLSQRIRTVSNPEICDTNRKKSYIRVSTFSVTPTLHTVFSCGLDAMYKKSSHQRPTYVTTEFLLSAFGES